MTEQIKFINFVKLLLKYLAIKSRTVKGGMPYPPTHLPVRKNEQL